MAKQVTVGEVLEVTKHLNELENIHEKLVVMQKEGRIGDWEVDRVKKEVESVRHTLETMTKDVREKIHCAAS